MADFDPFQYYQPSKGQLKSFTCSGVSLTQYVHCIRVYESVCKEYLTAQVVLYDTNNLIENMGIRAQDAATLEFYSPPNSFHYTGNCTFRVLKMKGEQVPDTLKYQIYYLDLIGPQFYQDRSQKVQRTYQDVPGTAAISDIWNSYTGADGPLDVLTQASGMIGTKDQPYSVANENPFTAIKNIMRAMVSDVYRDSGSWLIFRDRSNVKLVQLEQLVNQYVAPNNINATQEFFTQKETWGAAMAGTTFLSGPTGFNDKDLYHAIIVAQAMTRSGDGGRGGGAEAGGAANQAKTAFDLGSGNVLLGGLLGGGNMTGMQITDSIQWANGTAPFNKTTGEVTYSGLVRDGASIVLRVPLQTGLRVTVGQSVWAELVPPLGNVGNYNIHYYILRGPWLITDLVHELYTDEREAQGTTSMQGVRCDLVLGLNNTGPLIIQPTPITNFTNNTIPGSVAPVAPLPTTTFKP